MVSQCINSTIVIFCPVQQCEFSNGFELELDLFLVEQGFVCNGLPPDYVMHSCSLLTVGVSGTLEMQ